MSPAPPQDLEPVTPQNRRLLLIVVVATAVIGLDQITKAWALAALDDGPIGLLGGVRFALTFNTRGAFGLGGSLVPFLAVVAVALVLVVVARGAATSGAMGLSLGLVLGGAFGNLADRVFRSPGGLRGAVVDFIDFRVWPVFNLADTAITCGCLLLLWLGWTQREA